MSIIVFDTETTGFPVKPRGFYSYHDPSELKYYDNARILELGWAVLDLDTFAVVKKQSFLLAHEGILPENYPGAFSAHGITNEEYLANGHCAQDALQCFIDDLEECSMLVAHNFAYDGNLLMSEFYRAGLNRGVELMKDVTPFCTMKEMTGVVDKTSYKSPKLVELYQFLLGHCPEQTHRALGDVELTVACFQELFNQGHFSME